MIGGSIPEKDGDKMYNTCPIFDPKGNLIAKHRKVHLFDSIYAYKKNSNLNYYLRLIIKKLTYLVK